MQRITLTGVAHLVGCCPTNPGVTSWIPSWGTCVGCGFGSGPGTCERQPIAVFPVTSMFLTLSFSLPSPYSKNK